MSYSSRHVVYVDLPEWAGLLTQYYWRIRVEGRNKALQRRYYRYVSKEKLRLAELGLDQDLIRAICKYLAKLDVVSARKVDVLLKREIVQMNIDFYFY